jgi:hypothetical protein
MAASATRASEQTGGKGPGWRLTTEWLEPRLRTSSIPTLPYVAPHTEKIHTLITPGIRHRAKKLVFKAGGAGRGGYS